MAKLFILAVLCFSIGLVRATPVSAPEPRDESLDNYIDMVMSNLQILLVEGGLDPLPLPNVTTGFSDVVLGVEWHGEATAYEGFLKGMATMYRSGSSDFLYNPETGGVIGIRSELGIGAMKAHYKLLAQFMDLGPIADVTIDINGASNYFEAALDQEACVFQVQEIEVTHIGLISVDITGLGVLNWIVELVTEAVVNVIKFTIENTIENSITNIMNAALGSVDLSILGGILGCEPQTNATVPLVRRIRIN